MNVVHTVIIFLFMIALMIFGLWMSRDVKDSKDWMVAGNSLGIIPLVGTYFATIVSATSIVSYAGYYYFNGWSGLWNCAGTLLTSFLAAIYYAKRLKKIARNTLPDYLEDRFGQKHATLAAIIILVGTVAMTAAQVVGGAIVLQTATGFDRSICIIVVSIIFILFTAVGGMKAVAWSDTLCSGIIIIGVWVMAFTLLGKVGGFGAMQESIYKIDPQMLQPFSEKIPFVTAVSWIVTWGLGNFGAPQYITRFYAAKSPEHAERSQAFTGVALIIFFIPLMIIGLCGAILLPGIMKQDQVTPTLIATFLSPVSGGILMAAIMAACVSTADSLLLLCGTTFTNDIYCKFINKNATDKEVLNISRITTLIVGVLAVGSTYFLNDAMMWIQARSVTMIGSAIAVLVLIGLIWRRANATGAMASMICGFTTAVIWYALGQPFKMMPLLPAVIVGTIVLVVVSLVTEPTPEKVLDKFFPEKEKKYKKNIIINEI